MRENLISKKTKLDLQSKEFLKKARIEKKRGRPVECKYFLKKKKLNEVLNKKLTNHISMADTQIDNINTLQNDIEFAQVLKTSNKVLSDLKDQNSLETFEETMELLQSTDMHQSRIKELMEEYGEGDIDEHIKEEYEFLNTQSQIENLNDEKQFNQIDDQPILQTS